MSLTTFFRDLFTAIPIEDDWKIYKQNAFKIAIKYTNRSDKPRPMPEYRNGNDGKNEVDDNGDIKLLEPNKTIWIAIEPSGKKYKYDDTPYWAAAAYPKPVEGAKEVWDKLDDVESIIDIYKMLITRIPFFQIASTLVTLNLVNGMSVNECVKILKAGMKDGKSDLGFSGIIQLFRPKSVSIGILVTKNHISQLKSKYFPTSYTRVPFVKGMLLLLKLNIKAWQRGKMQLQSGNHEYTIEGKAAFGKYLMYPIDAPAVRGALWKAETNDDLLPLLKKAQHALSV